MTTTRDTIAGALYIERFALCARGPKAQNMTAQGNALGTNAQIESSPERAAQKSDTRIVTPLQGALCGFDSRGVAPGFHVIALSARDAVVAQSFCKSRTLNAAQKPRVRFVAPLQGALFGDFVSRGVAPGFHVVAPSARDAVVIKDARKVFVDHVQ
jgi:hypothetical protein